MVRGEKMEKIKEPLKNVTVTVITEKQRVISFIYSDNIKQDCIDFVRDMGRLHDNTKEYRITVKMYLDFNRLYDIAEVLTDDILMAISFITMHVNQFLRG